MYISIPASRKISRRAACRSNCPPLQQKRRAVTFATTRLVFNPGTGLLSHPVAQAVPSALEGLTTVFGMGTGVTLPL